MKARVHKISESWKMHWVREDVPVRCTLCGCYCPVVAWFMVKLRGLASIICWEPPGSVVQAWCNSMTKLWTASNTWISPKNKKYALMDWTETETETEHRNVLLELYIKMFLFFKNSLRYYELRWIEICDYILCFDDNKASRYGQVTTLLWVPWKLGTLPGPRRWISLVILSSVK